MDAYRKKKELQCVAEEDPPEDEVVFEVAVQSSRTREPMKIPVKQFQFRMLKPDFLITLDGQRRAGKSTWVRTMLRANRPYFSEVYIFTGSEISEEYKGLVRDDCIFDNLDTREDGTGGCQMLFNIYLRNKARIKEMRKRKVNDKNLWVLCVIEDLVSNETGGGSGGFHHISLFDKIAFNGRHCKLSLVITSQNIKAIPPKIKQNTDACVLFGINSQRTKETVRESFCDSVRNDTELDELFAFLYKIPHSSAVILRNDPRKHPNECIYMGVPQKDDTPFFMGSREYWYGAEAELVRNGFGHWLDIPADQWGIDEKTYMFDAMGPSKKDKKKKPDDPSHQSSASTGATDHAG